MGLNKNKQSFPPNLFKLFTGIWGQIIVVKRKNVTLRKEIDFQKYSKWVFRVTIMGGNKSILLPNGF